MAIDVGSAIGYLDIDISGFLSGLETALNQTESSKNKIEALGSKISGTGKNFESVGKSLTKNVTVPLVALGTAGLKVATDFESGMSQVQAITGAVGEDFDALRDQAIDLGASTAFSAGEVAGAMTEMAKAGWTTQDILDGMSGVLDATAASGENLGTVSTIVADAITGFGLVAGDSTRVANLLTQAANSGTIGISDLGESFKYIAPVAQSMGLSIEDVVTAISAMSMAGIKGSSAGTSLRTMLTNLIKPTDAMSAAMDELGIEVTNTDGTIKSLDEIIGIMRTSFEGLTDEQKSYYAATLAGKEGMSGLLSILNLTQEEYDAIAASMDNCNGVAQETATVMQDNLQSKLEQLGGALESLAIIMADNVIPAFTDFIEWLTGMVEKFTELSPGAQKFILVLAGIAIAVGPVISRIGKLTSGIGSVVTFIGKASGKFSGFASAASTVAAPAEAAGKGVGSLAKSALNLLAAGAGILMAAGGLALLAQSAIALSEAGWPAIAVMGGLVAVLAGLAVGAAAVGPALTAGAVGLVAFGGAVALIGVGVLAATSGVALLATQLPTISEHGGTAAEGLLAMGGAIAALAVGCIALDIAVVALLIPLAGLTLELGLSAAACGLLSAAMESTATSVTTIEDSAVSAAQSLSEMVTSVDVVKAGMTSLTGVVTSTMSQVKSGLSSGMDDSVSAIDSGMSDMASSVESGMGEVNSTIRSGFQSAVSYIRSLIGQAPGWGADIISGIAAGIRSHIGVLSSAVDAAAGVIYSKLHFSRPDEGPLRDYETWMPDFMEGLAKGINSNLYQIEGAVGNVADRMVIKPEGRADQMFSASASSQLKEYNIILVNTLELYRQLVEQMRLCSTYALSIHSGDNNLLKVGTTQLDSPLADVPQPTNPGDPKKPDILNVNVHVGEEQIETVVVDLLRREVRT